MSTSDILHDKYDAPLLLLDFISNKMAARDQFDWSDVIRDGDDGGPVLTPMKETNNWTVVISAIICTFGLSNFYYVYKIIVSIFHLYRQTRNMFQLILAVCSVFSALLTALEIVQMNYPSDLQCKIIVSLNGLPSQLFYFNLSLAVVDRYLAITRTALWYHDHVTVKRIVIYVPILDLALALVLKWVFIFQLAPLTCSYNVVHVSTLGFTLLIQWLFCFSLNIATFIKNRKKKTQSVVFSLSVFSTAFRQKELNSDEMATGNFNPNSIAKSISSEGINQNYNYGSSLAQTETSATRMTVIFVSIVLVLAMPLIGFSFYHLIICNIPPTSGYDMCNINSNYWSNLLMPYFILLVDLGPALHPLFLYFYFRQLKRLLTNSNPV